jgi:hypothetical protein
MGWNCMVLFRPGQRIEAATGEPEPAHDKLELSPLFMAALLTQLAQFGGGFCDFTRIGVSRIKGLWSGDGGFGL